MSGILDKIKTAVISGKYARELEGIISAIEMDMANNYKDNAQSGFKELEAVYNRLAEEGKLSEKDKSYYEGKLRHYRERLMGYSHKDQKPYWTKE